MLGSASDSCTFAWAHLHSWLVRAVCLAWSLLRSSRTPLPATALPRSSLRVGMVSRPTRGSLDHTTQAGLFRLLNAAAVSMGCRAVHSYVSKVCGDVSHAPLEAGGLDSAGEPGKPTS